MRILFVHNGLSRFVKMDLDLLGGKHEVTQWHQDGRAIDFRRLWGACSRSDLVFGWFASWHTFFPAIFASRLRKPMVLVIGGYDVARMPEIDYGSMRGGPRKWVARSTISVATRLTTVSKASLEEIRQNLGAVADRVRVIYHGVPDVWGREPPFDKEAMALTAGTVDRTTLVVKGHRSFVSAARLLPDVTFVLAGGDADGSGAALKRDGGANVSFPGQLEPAELDRLYGRASVYVQASRHESFGMAVAESMLAGCIPVVTTAGALPEVVGDTGVYLESGDPSDIAAGITTALAAGPGARRRSRERVLSLFPPEQRQVQLLSLVEEAV